MKHYPALDGLRGLAAMAVVFGHASNANMGVIYALPLGGLGRVAVWLFFVLSAFLLTQQALIALRTGEYPDVAHELHGQAASADLPAALCGAHHRPGARPRLT